MKECQNCKSKRIVRISGKCRDMCSVSIPSENIRIDGYSPRILGVTGKDSAYIEFSACLDCGQLQGKFPQPNPEV